MHRMRNGLLIIFLIPFAACNHEKTICTDSSHNELTLVNQSGTRIYFEFYWNYPDTTIGEYNPVWGMSGGLQNCNNMDISRVTRGGCLEELYADGRKEWLYIFNADTIEALDWNIVRSTQRGLIARIELSLAQMESSDFIVVFE